MQADHTGYDERGERSFRDEEGHLRFPILHEWRAWGIDQANKKGGERRKEKYSGDVHH